MEGLDPNIYQLYQQHLAQAGVGAGGQAAFFQPPPPPQAPMLDEWLVDPAGYVAAEAPQPLQNPGGGVWAENGGGFVPDDGDWAGNGGVAHGQAWAAAEDLMMLDGNDVFPGNDQLVHGGGFPSLHDLVMGDVDSLWASPPFMDSLPANQAAAHPSTATTYAPSMVPAQPASDSSGPSAQFGATESPGLTPHAYPPVVDYPQAPPQFVHGGSVPDVQDLLMDGLDLSQFDDEAVNSLWVSAFMNSQAANQDPSGTTSYAPPMVPAAEPNQPPSDSSGPSTQVGSTESPGLTSRMPAYPPVIDYPQAPPPAASVDTPQGMPDDETAEVAQMVGIALRCDDKVSTEWSEEENQVLREGLSRFAGQDNVTKCFNIASGLGNKTVIDVAYRIRWLSDLEKKRAAKQAQLEQEKSAAGKVTKGKGIKGPTRKNNKYPLSKEALNAKSAKDLIRDNDRLMDKIEEILKTGQVENCPDYFYYLKMNMDALQNKVTGMSTVMEGLSVDDEEWEDVFKDRHSLAGKDSTAPP